MAGDFAKTLKRLRAKNGLTLDELAKATGTTKATLSKYENGLREPGLSILIRIADYFRCSIDELVGRREGEVVK